MISLDFTKVAAQSRAFAKLTPGNRVCNAWGRGVGKSWFLRQFAYLLVAQWDGKLRPGASLPGVRIVILMPTLVQFKKVHADLLEAELGALDGWKFLGGVVNKSDWRVRFPGGSWIQVVSAETGTTAAGIRCDAVLADESDDIDIAFYEAIAGPWCSEPHSLNIRLVTGTPRRGRFGLLWRAFSTWPNGDATCKPVPGSFAFKATYLDAPDFVGKENVELEKGATSPDRFAREWLCDFDSGEGLVYPFFDPAFHVRRPPSFGEFHSFIVGYDYGFEDPSAFSVIGIAGKGRDTICHVVREHYVRRKSDTELASIAQSIDRAFPDAQWYSDHHPSTIAAFRDVGIKIHPAEKGPGSVERGVAFVADALFIRETSDDPPHRWAQLYVDPECQNTIEEFGLYRRRRDPHNTERVLDDIDSSKNDHAMDALRYALFTHFGGPDRRLGLR